MNAISTFWWVMWAAALLTVPSVLIRKAGRPTTSLSWILALFVFPPLVVPCWWLVGRTHLNVRRKRRRSSASEFGKRLLEHRGTTAEPGKPAKGLLDIVGLPEEIGRWVFPPTSGNGVTLLDGAQQAYDTWVRAIEGARRNIHLLFYEWEQDAVGERLRNALIAATRRGVTVRVLVDGIGTGSAGRFFKPLRETGGIIENFLPLRIGSRPATINFRNHRKLIVVDGKTAFIGGMNVGTKYLKWVDLAVELRGPGVDQVQEIFCDDWYFATGDDFIDTLGFGHWAENSETPVRGMNCSCATVAGGPHQQMNAIREITLLALGAARERIWIMTPYFIPDSEMGLVLRMARYRGVDVRVIVPAKSNHYLVRRASRAYYRELLGAGVRIFEFNGMMHAKTSIIDRYMVCIGSANIDQRSFQLNFELSCFLESRTLASDCQHVFERTLGGSREIMPENVDRAPWPTRTMDAALHLLSPLL